MSETIVVPDNGNNNNGWNSPLGLLALGNGGGFGGFGGNTIGDLIGLAIVGLAEVITATVANTIRDAQKVSQIESTQIIAKEENEKQIN